VVCNHQGEHFRGQDIDDPMNTVTAARDAVGVVVPSVVKFQTGSVGRPAEEPVSTITANPQQGVVAAHLMSMKGNDRRDSAADVPHPTVLAGGGHSSLVAPHLMTMRNAGKPFNG